MTDSANSPTVVPRHRGASELSSTVPVSARVGDLIWCGWRLVNNRNDAITASLYLRATPARLAELACSRGKILCGYHHGSAILPVPGGEETTISALLELLAAEAHQIRVAVVTRNETHFLIDTVTVEFDDSDSVC